MAIWGAVQGSAASASGTGAPDKPVQAIGKPGPPLAIEDVKDRDRLLYKVEEALRGSYVLSLKFSKVIARLPATILGSRHKASLEDMDIVMKEREPLLKHLAINVGLCPARARPLVSMS